MERSSSRLQAPAARAHPHNSTTHSNTGVPTKRGSGGGATGPLQPAAFGYRRPSAPSAVERRRSSREGAATMTPPRLALHELHDPVPAPPPATATYLKRGSGRTIATLGNPVVSPPPSTRRKSAASPRTATPNERVNATSLRSRHGSRENVSELLAANKMDAKSYESTNLPMPPNGNLYQHQPLQPPPQPTPLSPASYFRRKRSADMMDPLDPLYVSPEQPSPEEVDEPPMNAVPLPMTPPPRTSGAHENNGVTVATMPTSPPDSKRQKRLTRSPKTPLGLPTYETEDGGLSAAQRVRLSLSGYMTVASLTGVGSAPKSARRESGATSSLLSNGEGSTPSDAITTTDALPRSASSRLERSTTALARSRFAASRSMSGPAHLASVLVSPKNTLDCLTGYIRELQRSEKTLRIQLETTRKQGGLDRSVARVNSLEKTIRQITNEREREQQQLQDQARTIAALEAELATLRRAKTLAQEPLNGSLSYDPSTMNGVQEQAAEQWGPTTDGLNGYAGASMNGYPAASYITPPPSRTGGQYQYIRTQQQEEVPDTSELLYNNAERAVVNGPSGAPMAPTSTEWTGENTEYYQSEAFNQYPCASAGDAYYPPKNDYPAATTDYNGQAYYPADPNTHHNTPASTEWTEPQAPYEVQASFESPAAPMSPVAKLDPSRSPQDLKALQPQIETPPPMFRVAPRLSDILSRSMIAAPVTTDHNVLKPVTPQALANANVHQPRSREVAQKLSADQEFMMTPPPLGPPAFSMSGFQSSSEPSSTPPPPASKPKGIVSNSYAHPLPDPPTDQGEEFVPAEQVFKPFHKPKTTPTRKASARESKRAKPLSVEALKELLIEFFMTVDKTKLRMVEGYSKRYQGQEAKLLSELTKKYGEQKLAPLKQKIESASKPPVVPEPTAFESTQAAPAAPPAPPMATTLSRPQQYAEASVSNGAPTPDESVGSWPTEPVAQPIEYENVGARSVEPPLAAAHTSQDAQASHGTVPPPPPSMAMSPPPSQKVSPTRRGPPLPFEFEEDEAPLEMLPPPPVVVTAPPVGMMAPPLPPPQSPPPKTAPSPPRIAPSPPRIPPPPASERSPARNASVLRQRVSPQRLQPRSVPPLPLAPPHTLAPPTPTPSPPKPTATPVTLESLLLEFYRKHQPDRLKNVPEVVKQYTGKERELIGLLKQKYGALSIKRLEQNVEVLEQQSAAAKASSAPKNPATASVKTPKTKSRGCVGRLVFFLLKLVVIRVVVMVLLFSGLVALDHRQCAQGDVGEAVSDSDMCHSLRHAIESFEMSRLTTYAQQFEPRECFCDQWWQREARLEEDPSVTRAVELLKLVPFSRTIAQPAWLGFVDTYLPNLPYSEYYYSYAKPAFLAGKGYAVRGVTHAKEVYEKVSDMPWHEWYESSGKPLVLQGQEHVVVAYHELRTRVLALPWGEYYDLYGKRAVEITRDFAYEGLRYTIHAGKELVVLVRDQWAVLVEMYNEEGQRTASLATEESTASTSSGDMLTKVARASKALAESTDQLKDKDSAEATIEPIAPQEEATGLDEVELLHSTETPVEVVMEQAGLDLSYATTEGDGAVEDMVAEDDTISNSADEMVEGRVTQEKYDDSPVEETVVDQETADLAVEVPVVADESVEASDSGTVEEAVEPIHPMSGETVSAAAVGEDRGIDHEDVAKDTIGAPVELSVEEAIGETEGLSQQEHNEHAYETNEVSEVQPATTNDESRESVHAVDEEQVTEEADLPSMSPPDSEMAADTTTVAETETQTVEATEQTIVEADAGVHTSEDVASGAIIEDVTSVAVDEDVSEGNDEAVTTRPIEVVVIEESNEDTTIASLTAEATDVGLEDVDAIVSAAKGDVKMAESSPQAEKDDTVEHEDLGFLEEGEGLDPLELLDLADLAAAELHSIN